MLNYKTSTAVFMVALTPKSFEATQKLKMLIKKKKMKKEKETDKNKSNIKKKLLSREQAGSEIRHEGCHGGAFIT